MASEFNNALQVLAFGLKSTGRMVEMFCEDLKPEEYLFRTTPKANCVAWLLGHLISIDHRVTKALGGTNLPELPEGFTQRFSREGDAPGANDFGDVTKLLPLFRESRMAFVNATLAVNQSTLDRPLEKPSPRYSTNGEMVAFMAHHTAMHAGQITMIRRALGRPPIV